MTCRRAMKKKTRSIGLGVRVGVRHSRAAASVGDVEWAAGRNLPRTDLPTGGVFAVHDESNVGLVVIIDDQLKDRALRRRVRKKTRVVHGLHDLYVGLRLLLVRAAGDQ